MRAQVSETVRIFIGNGGPNLASSFHVISEISASSTRARRGVDQHQTTLIPAARLQEFTVDVPGDYILVDHSINRASGKGAMPCSRRGPENRDFQAL